jgi:hypothetical protein
MYLQSSPNKRTQLLAQHSQSGVLSKYEIMISGDSDTVVKCLHQNDKKLSRPSFSISPPHVQTVQ